MKHAPILTLIIASQVLAACGGSNFAGGIRAQPLPAAITTPCEDPKDHLEAGDWEIIAGRLGDALIECGAEKAVAVDAYNGVAGIVGAQ